MAFDHYLPRFYLRNFCGDKARTRLGGYQIHNGHALVYRDDYHIDSVGGAKDYYVVERQGGVRSFDPVFNRAENEITSSETWNRIRGDTDALAMSDREMLIYIVNHLWMRNPAIKKLFGEGRLRHAAGERTGTWFDHFMDRSLKDSGAEQEFFALCNEWQDLLQADTCPFDVVVCPSPIELWTSTSPLMNTHPGFVKKGSSATGIGLPLTKNLYVFLNTGNSSTRSFIRRPLSVSEATSVNRSLMYYFLSDFGVDNLFCPPVEDHGMFAAFGWNPVPGKHTKFVLDESQMEEQRAVRLLIDGTGDFTKIASRLSIKTGTTYTAEVLQRDAVGFLSSFGIRRPR